MSTTPIQKSLPIGSASNPIGVRTPPTTPLAAASVVMTRPASTLPGTDRISIASSHSRPRATLQTTRVTEAPDDVGTGVEMQALHARDASAAERGDTVVASPGAASVHAFPQTLAAWDTALAREAGRPIDVALAARVLDEIRNKGRGDLGQTHAQALAQVSDAHVAQWRQALGLTPEEVALMRANARTVGRFVPTSATLFNGVNFGVLPWLSLMGSRNPVVNAGIAVASAGIAQPVTTTLIQTPVIAALDTWRKKMGHAVALDGAVNAKRTPAQVAGKLGEVNAKVERNAQRLDSVQADGVDADAAIHALFDQMASAYGVDDDATAADGAPRSQRILERMEAEPDVGRRDAFRDRLITLGHRQLENQATLAHLSESLVASQHEQKELSDSLRMSVGMLDRQKRSTHAQEWTRILRAASGLVTVAGKAIEKSVNAKPTLYPTAAAVGLAAAALMAQHFAAGRDEQVGASDMEEKLNMLYGRDYLNAEGRQALVDGTPVQPGHLEPDALRKLAPGAATQMLAQVTKMVALQRSLLDEADPHDQAALQAFDDDLAALDTGRPSAVRPAGVAHKLLQEVMAGGAKGHPIVFAGREGWNKMTTLEMSAQLGQRMGLAWLGLVLGNVGATAASRVITAALGGPGVASLPAQFGAAALATVAGVTSAKFAWMPVPIKNERRAEPGRVSFLSQLGSSLVAPAWTWRQSSAAAGALEAAARGTPTAGAAPRTDAGMQALIDAMPGAFGASLADSGEMPPR